MATLQRILRFRIVSDASAAVWGQYLCFAAAPALLIVAIRGITRMATTQAELLIGILASAAVAMLMVNMGLLLPLTQQKPQPTPKAPVAEAANRTE
jgi:hypothetical protein